MIICWDSLLQTCHAYESEGGRVIVVMTQRDKIGMEALFRRVIPPHKRLGSQFVFRQASVSAIADFLALLVKAPGPAVPWMHEWQAPSSAVELWLHCNESDGLHLERRLADAGVQGSPLVPADLKMVSASSAAATVIVSDSSRRACASSYMLPQGVGHRLGYGLPMPSSPHEEFQPVFILPSRIGGMTCSGQHEGVVTSG